MAGLWLTLKLACVAVLGLLLLTMTQAEAIQRRRDPNHGHNERSFRRMANAYLGAGWLALAALAVAVLGL